MKKKTFLVSALSVLLLALSACDQMIKPSSSEEPAPQTSSVQPVDTSSQAGTSSNVPASSSEIPASSSTPVSSSEATSSSESGSSSQAPVPEVYTITFASNGGTGTMQAVSKEQGESYTLPQCGFTREGYTFDYWQVGNDTTHRAVGYQFVVNGNVTVTAQWAEDEPPAPTEYTVTYAAGEGTGTMNPVVVDAGSEYTLPACGFTKEGYHFDYWQVGNDAAHKAAGDKITVIGDVTVTAKWAQDEPAPVTKYTVSFLHGEGTGEMQSVDVNAGEEYTLPESTFTAPAGKEFKAWQVGEATDERAPGYKFTVDANVEITALWKNEDVYVLYLYNGLNQTEIPLSKDGDAYTAQVTYSRGMYFTATKNGEEYALTAENYEGNNVKVINDKVTAISNENATESIWVHTDEEHTVWLNGYEEEYFLTIGGIEAKLERNTAQTEFKEFYTPEAERFPAIHANETISITHDLETYEYTKNTGDTNNISPLDVHKVNNDATNVSAYLNVDAGTLLIGGYVPQYVMTVVRDETPYLVKDFEHVDGTTYSTTFTFEADDIITGISKDGVVYDSLGVDPAEDNNAYLDSNNIKIHVYAPNAPIYLHDTDNPNIYVYKPSYIVTINDTPYTMAANGNTYFKEFDSLDAGTTISFKHGTSDIEFAPEVKVGQTNNIKNDKTVFRTNDNVVLTLNVADVENYTAWLTGYYDIHQVTVSRGGVEVEGYIDLQLLPQQDGQYKLDNLPVQKNDVLSFKLNGADDTTTPIDDSDSNNLTAAYKIRTASEGVTVWINNNNKIYVDGFVHDYHVTVGTRQYEITLNTTELEPFYEGVVATANKDEVVSMYIDDVEYVLTSKSGENNVYDKTPNTPTVRKTYNESTTNKVYITDLDAVNHTGNIWLDGYTAQYAVLINGVASGVTISKYDASSYTGTIPSVERGDILTFTLDGAPIDLISQVVDGNNVKDVAGDMKVRTNKENAEIWIHINANDVWLGGYVEEYTVTIGSNTYALTKKDESTEWYNKDVEINVTQGAVISVKHDGESFAVTRKADDPGVQTQYINNIDTINLSIHNDAENVSVYVDVNGNTIYINGYQVIEADYDYYVSYDSGAHKTKMTPDNTGAPEGAEQYKAAIDAEAEMTVSFYRCYNEEYTLITTVSPDDGSNVRATETAGVLEVITTDGDVDYIYLKYFASSQTFKVWLDGYVAEYKIGTNKMTKDGEKAQYLYEFAAATDVKTTTFSFYKDREIIDASLISIPEGQNIRRIGATNTYQIITALTANTNLYLKLVDNAYELYMGGYSADYYITVDGTKVDLTKNGNEWSAQDVVVENGDEIVVYKDGLVDESFGVDTNVGNNLDDMVIVVGGTVDIYVKPLANNVWVSGFAHITIGSATHELSWHSGEDGDYYTVNINSAGKDEAITVSIGGTYTPKVANQDNNNVRIKNDALRVITAITAQQVVKVYPAENDAYVFLGGYSTVYGIIVTRDEVPSAPVYLTWSQEDSAYKGVYNFVVGDVLSATKDDSPIDLVNDSGDGNNVGANLTITVGGSNVPMYFHVTGEQEKVYDIYVYTPSYVAVVNGAQYTMSVNAGDSNIYEATIPSVTAGQTVSFSFNNVALDGVTLDSKEQETNNIINDSGYKVFKSGNNVTISINKTNKKAWMTGYYPEYAVNGTALVAKYEEEVFKEWGANLSDVADGTVLTFRLDGGTYEPTPEADEFNNAKLVGNVLKVITGGDVYVALKSNGQFWVTGFAQVTVGANTYLLERDYDRDEFKIEIPVATAGDVVTVRLDGDDFAPLTASTGANNVEVVSSQLKVRQTVENMTIYVHEDYSVWLDGYVQPLNPVTNYNFSTEIDPGEGKYIFVHSWSASGTRTSYVKDGKVGVIENATGYLVGVDTTNVESNAYPTTSVEAYRTANRTDLNGDTIVYQLTGNPAVYNAYITWQAPATYNSLVGYKNNGQENYTALDCDNITWYEGVPYRQYTYQNNNVATNDTVTIAELISEAYQPITSNISFENTVTGKMTLTDGVVTFLFNGKATLYIKYGKNDVKIYASYEDDATVKVKFTADYDVGYNNGLYIAGTVNSWSAQRMSYNTTTGLWEIEIDVAPGPIQYKFIKANYNNINVDQVWEKDRSTSSKNREYTVTVAETIETNDIQF